MDDLDLLKAYADHQDQEAFAHLVRRHSPWLYAAARRQLGDGHLAEDVTQAVFLVLSRRARRLRHYSYLSGWLFLALGYCIRNLKQQRARRERREQKAAAMRPERIEPESNWDEVAPRLEEAVGRLRRQDRDAVLLRFYERKPLAEVGRAMGVSEEAARKRVDRAVERLREMLQKEGVTGTSAGLSAVLVGNVVQEVPGRLVDGVLAAIGGGGSAVAGGIAKGAIKIMVLGNVKMAAVVAVLAGGVGLTVAGVIGHTPAPTPATIVSEADPKAPGKVRLVRSKLWVDEKGAAALKAAGKPVATKSQWFQAMLVPTDAVHQILSKVQLPGGAVDLQQLHSPDRKMTWPGYGTPPSALGLGRNRSSVVRIQPPSLEGKSEHKPKPDGLQLQLALDGLKAIYFTAQGETSVPASLVFDGEVPGGMALVFVGGFEAEGAYCLDIWEAVRMTNAQAQMMMGVGEGQWFGRTPAQWREFTDRSLVWQEKGKTLEQSDHLGQRVGSGVEVRVVGISRPGRWPGCWWTPSGEPIREVSGEPKTGKTVVALKVITRPEEQQGGPVRVQYMHQWNQIGGHVVFPNGEETVVELPDESGKLTVKVADGKWRRLGTMAKDKPLVDEGLTARVEGTDVVGTTMCSTSVIGTGLPDGPMRLVALDANDVEVGRSWEPGLIQIGEDHGGSEKRIFLPIHNLSATPVKFALEACGYEKTKFEGMTMVPKVSPPESVTEDAVKAAQMSERAQKIAEVVKQWEESRKRYEAVPADDITPQGLFKRMLEAAAAGRKEEVTACLTSPEPSEKDSVQVFIRMLLASTRCCDAVVAKFGLEQIVRDNVKLNVPGKYELMVYDWQIDGEKATTDKLTARRFNGDQATSAGLSMRRSNGYWQLEAASIAQKPMAASVAHWAEGLESISTAIADGQIGTTRQLNDAIEKLPKP